MTRSRTDANVRSLRPAGRGPMLATAAMVALSALVAAQGPPPTDKRAVVDTYHGTTVTDEYRWLERWDDPAVQKWSDAQNVHARAFTGCPAGARGDTAPPDGAARDSARLQRSRRARRPMLRAQTGCLEGAAMAGHHRSPG